MKKGGSEPGMTLIEELKARIEWMTSFITERTQEGATAMGQTVEQHETYLAALRGDLASFERDLATEEERIASGSSGR